MPKNSVSGGQNGSSINFSDTKVAFAHKSSKELKKSYLLFKALSYSLLVKSGPMIASVSLKLRLPTLRNLIRDTMFGQFCGGESIEECVDTIQHLGQYNVGTILDFATEGCHQEQDFERVKAEIKHSIELAQVDENVPFAVFKPTGVGRAGLLEKRDSKQPLSDAEKAEFNRVEQRFLELCKYASDHEVPILIDAEESWIQDSVDELARKMMLQFNQKRCIVYTTIQLYRKDRLNFLKQAYADAEAGNYFFGVKLVRGAYLEKEAERARLMGFANPIHKSKEATDQDFNTALRFCVENINRISLVAGTHNEYSTQLLIHLLDEFKIDRDNSRIYFAQLLGMSDNLSFPLSKSGYQVCKYVPYGKLEELLPYLSRRAEENSSIQGQTGRELALITEELKRRQTLGGDA